MDLRTFQIGFAVFVHLIFLIQPVNLKSLGRECRQCKPGYYASRHCTETHDTVCKLCPKGTFTSKNNKVKTCTPCSICDVGEFVSKECSVKRDAVCESCAAVKGKVNDHFIRSCLQDLQGDDSSDNLRLSDPSNVKLDKEGSVVGDLSSSESLTVLPEGSGVGIIEEIGDTSYPITNVTDELEGSGAVTVDETVDLNTTVSAILPDTGDETIAETGTPTNITTTTTTTTTSKDGIIAIGDGIKLENITSVKADTNTIITTTQASIKTITVDDNTGVVIDYNPSDVADEAIEDEVGGAIDVDINVGNEEPQTGASHKKRDESQGVSTGVVVTVGLVAALVFFVIGFVVSRYWSRRQERTFNVQEAERRNGKPPIECSGMEYKDPENNIPGKTNIYGKVPTSKTANGNTPEVKPQHAQSDKPVVVTSSPKTGSQPNNTEPNDDVEREWAGFTLSRNDSSGSLILRPTVKPRAESEIRYIDEDPADEHDALIQQTSPNPSQPGNSPQTGNASSQEVDLNSRSDANNESLVDENTPMISKTNNTS